MPIYDDKPLPPIQNEDYITADSTLLAPGWVHSWSVLQNVQLTIIRLDLLRQVREAKYSPSPVTRILQDPTLFNASSSPGDPKKRHKSRERRTHRTPMVAAMAIAEEERQASHLKSLLQATGDRLEHEMRRAEEATARADFTDRQAHELLERARVAEIERAKMKEEMVRMERETRNLQIQLEAAQRETKRVCDDMEDIRQEMEQLQRSERKAHASNLRNELTLKEYQKQAAGVQKMIDACYENGQNEGYNEGYELGYEDGREAGMKKGRKEGLREGIERGRYEERQNAIQAFDNFLITDKDATKVSTQRIYLVVLLI